MYLETSLHVVQCSTSHRAIGLYSSAKKTSGYQKWAGSIPSLYSPENSDLSQNVLFRFYSWYLNRLLDVQPVSHPESGSKDLKSQRWPVVDPGLSRSSCQPRVGGGVLTYYSAKYLLNITWNQKKIGSRWRRASLAPPLDPAPDGLCWPSVYDEGAGRPRVLSLDPPLEKKCHGLPVLCRKEVQQALLFCLPFSLHDDNVCNCLLLMFEYFFD